jgi:O-antigen ligase
MKGGRSAAPDRVGDAVRTLVLVLLVFAPLAFGAFDAWAFIPLHVGAYTAGLVAWWRAMRARASGASPPPLPGARLLGAFVVLVALQLVPLPPVVLKAVSPGTFAFHERYSLVPLTAWKPISVSPADTSAGLAYLLGMALLYVAVFREFDRPRWRRRVMRTVVLVGVFMTFVALVQSASGQQKIYGLFAFPDDWATFGPYSNRNHFAGYVVMAIGLAFGSTIDALSELRRAWNRRRVGWLALGDPAGSAVVRRAAEATVLVVGLVACASRGGFVAFVGTLAAIALASRRRSVLVVILVVAVAGVSWIGLGGVAQGFENRGLQESRLALWRDALRMFPDFPVLGVGFNAFGMAYLRYQTFWRYYFFQAAHNEYLDVLLTTGLLGAGLAAAMLVLVLRQAWARARRTPIETGLLGAVVGLAVHNIVDFNWQIQANAATYAALVALSVQSLDPPSAEP